MATVFARLCSQPSTRTRKRHNIGDMATAGSTLPTLCCDRYDARRSKTRSGTRRPRRRRKGAWRHDKNGRTVRPTTLYPLFLFCTTVPYIPPGPEDSWLCCKRQCCVNTDQGVVNQLRRELWGGENDLELEEIKDMVKQARTGALLQPDGKACYVRFATKAADVSNNFLYGAKSNTDAVGQTNKSRFDGMEDSV